VAGYYQWCGHIIEYANQMRCAMAAMVVVKQLAILMVSIICCVCHQVDGHCTMVRCYLGMGVPGKGKPRPKIGKQQYAG